MGRTVAIVGASTDRNKFGNKAIRAYLNQCWEVYPVNPRGGEIEGLRAYASLAELPAQPDRVSLYLPPSLGMDVLEDVAAVGAGEFWVNPGAESDELVARARELGLDPIVACSIVAIGESPGNLPG